MRKRNVRIQLWLDKIKNAQSYDVLEMSGSRAVWKEVLAVYAVKTTTGPSHAQEVATMNDEKKQLLKDIFWEMNEISSRTETKIETAIETSDDGYGNIVETETTVWKSIPWKATLATPADRTAIPSGIMRFTATVFRRIKREGEANQPPPPYI